MIPSRYKGSSKIELFERPDSGHPPGTQTDVFVGILLILLCRAWSKLDVQVVVCNWVDDPIKAWVAGSDSCRASARFQRRRVTLEPGSEGETSSRICS